MEKRQQEKKDLRQRALLARQELSPAERHGRSAALCQHLARWLLAQAGVSQCFLFAGTRGEPELEALALVLWQQHYRVGLPVVAGPGRMAFYEWQAAASLKVNRFGIREPSVESSSLLAPNENTLVVVPALAIDHYGHRLGYGGGFYDRFLQEHPGVITVGVVWHEAFMQNTALPYESHDQRLQFVASELGVTQTRA